MAQQIKHLSETDLQTVESTWRKFDAAYQKEAAKYETKQNELFI